MEVEPIPSVEEMAAWMRLPLAALKQAEDLAATAWDLRQSLRGVYTSVPVGVYVRSLHDGSVKLAAVCDDTGLATPQDLALVKSAVSRVADNAGCLDLTEFNAEAALSQWTKVAYSPFLRRTGELLNFFPGKYPGGIPNSPGPVQSMLTSGLVGAGLGYGAGWAAEKLMPQTWKKGRLRKTLAVAGGLAGAVPGAIWAGSNLQQGKGFNDNSLLTQPTQMSPQDMPWKAAFDSIKLGTRYTEACAAYAEKLAADNEGMLKEAFGDSFATSYGSAPPPSPMSVNVDAMGRTLWETGASPQTAGMTMGALAAAQQMPGGDQPGFVTPAQMANLAVHMGAGYLSGAVVGHTLGLLTGMPDSTVDRLKQTGMYLGIVKSVVPRLFGQ